MDAVLDKAVDLAYEAAVEVAGDREAVGDHVSVTKEAERLVTHLFACTLPGYRGWVWAVTMARPPRGREATVCEAHLVPADDALLAPSWVPWADRVRPGDLEPSMVLPLIDEDQRLMPGLEATDEDADALEIWELGLGRERVLAPEGRDNAAERWYRGSHGPTAASAIASSAPCSTCAFFVPLSGSMRVAFGACANEWSPSDGRVVSVDHGCGAHSQTDVEKQTSTWPAPDPVFDTDAAEPIRLDEPEPTETSPAGGSGDASADAAHAADAPAAGASDADATAFTADAGAADALPEGAGDAGAATVTETEVDEAAAAPEPNAAPAKATRSRATRSRGTARGKRAAMTPEAESTPDAAPAEDAAPATDAVPAAEAPAPPKKATRARRAVRSKAAAPEPASASAPEAPQAPGTEQVLPVQPHDPTA